MQSKQWNLQTIEQLFELPFAELIYQAQGIHRKNFDPQQMELCTLANIKVGACPENCGYCAQSGHFKTGIKKQEYEFDTLIEQAKTAKANGARRFCMGAAWRSPTQKSLEKVIEIIKAVKQLDLEVCVTLGMLTADQSLQLKQAGLDFYNHNLDTSPEFYPKIISTRTYADRLKTLRHIDEAGMKICCGGILGMGESRLDRINLLLQLQQLKNPPTSIPINKLIPMQGTPLENAIEIDDIEFIKMIAVTRIIFPNSRVRLSAGREHMSDTMQTLCFMAGANSIFIGDTLLTANNPSLKRDRALLKKLGIC